MSDEGNGDLTTASAYPHRMRIVVLTSGGRAAPGFLRALAARGVVPEAVLVAVRSELAHCFHRPPGRARVAELPIALARSVVRRLRPRFRSEYRTGERLVVTSSLNSPRMIRALEQLVPDLVVLAGCTIITPEVIGVAKQGTVNSHPGLLPWVRGNGVVAHALLRGVPVGVTCHRVDKGIDTGPVLRRRLAPVTGSERSLAELEAAADRAAVELLVDVVESARATGTIAAGQPQRARYPLCRWLPRSERPAVDAAVAAGRARELFEEWRERAAQPGSLELFGDFGLGDGGSGSSTA